MPMFLVWFGFTFAIVGGLASLLLMRVATEHSSGINLRRLPQQQASGKKIPVGFVVVFGAEREYTKAEDSPVVQTLLPSLATSMTTDELDNFNISIYLGFEKGDSVWDVDLALVAGLNSTDMYIVPVQFPSTTGFPPTAVELCDAALSGGSEIIVIVSEFGRFRKPGIISHANDFLNGLNPHGYGIVKSIFGVEAFAMLHRVHFDMFKQLSPWVLGGDTLTKWFALTYGENRIATWNSTVFSLNTQFEQQNIGAELLGRFVQSGQSWLSQRLLRLGKS